jgi:CRP/FNR family cyclic AMP-dependent transcriptional regulator
MRTGLPIAGQSLAGVEIFSGLDLDARNAIAESCNGAEFAAGDTILGHLDNSRDVFLILSGTVEVNLYSVNGRRITFNEKGAGQMVGELAAIDGQPRSAHVIAKTNCLTAAISPNDFLQIIADNPSVTRYLQNHLVSQVRLLSERVFEFNALCVSNRIHVELLRCAQSADEKEGQRRTILPAPTHAEIASRVSTHREAVTRELGRLTKDGLLEKAKDALVVVEIEQLEKLVEEALGEIPVFC